MGIKTLSRANLKGSPRPVRVLQFGEGNFLRAFCDWMVDILNEKTDFNGDIQVIQPIRHGMGELLNSQDGLFHVVLTGIRDGKPTTEDRLIQCMKSVINPYLHYESYLVQAENPDLRFVLSNTTEAGIAFHTADVSMHSLPESFPGKVTALLYRRFKFFNGDPAKGLVFLPCELIERNGARLKELVLQYSQLWKLEETFIHWVENHNIFCNTLVDRIVPGFPKETIGEIHQRTGYADNLVVMAERFHLWVIETDQKLDAELPFAKAGLNVLFVQDLAPYRTRKVRILNGAHTAMVPVAFLRGLRTVRDTVTDSFMCDFVKKAISEEIIPTLDLPRNELEQYAGEVVERFENPFIRHELASIALNSVSKYSVRVLPSVMGCLKKGKRPDRLLTSLAALILFYRGSWNNDIFPVNDTPEVVDFFQQAWASGDVPKLVNQVLARKEFWGTDLNQEEGVTSYVTSSLLQLMKDRVSA